MKKVFIRTYGCAHNHADSEFMAGVLAEGGFEVTQSRKDADLVLINTCTVKDPSEKKFFSELKKTSKPVVVAGCIPQADREKLKDYSLIGIKQIHLVAEVVSQTLMGNTVQLLDSRKNNTISIPKIRKNPLVEIIPLSNGCLGYCTFCKTRMARGMLESFPERNIVSHVRNALNDGAKEIWLTAEDTGAYGLDIKTNLPSLLEKILKIPKNFKVRLGMINPEYAKKYKKDLIRLFHDERMFKFIHIPVQSGSDRILSAMKRKYTVDDFRKTVKEIKKRVPNITVATDVICGFPTETDDEFLKSVNLVREFRFPVVNISKFYSRKGTAASKMKQLDTKIVKERSGEMTRAVNAMMPSDEWLGLEGEVIIDEVGKSGTFIGRNDFYRPVVVKGKNLFGKKIKVRITCLARDYFKGEIINNHTRS